MQLKLENKQIGAMVALILAVIMLFLPGASVSKYAFDPADLSKAIIEQEDQMSPQELSEMIIAGKNNYQLVDIRSEKDFKKGAIRTAENIPLEKLLQKTAIDTDLRRDKTVVLYSNGNSHAHQAWLVLKAARIDAVVLEGGFNSWVNTILNPKAPKDATDDEILKYNLASSVANYFNGGSGINTVSAEDTATKAKPRKRRRSGGKKKLKGCGS